MPLNFQEIWMSCRWEIAKTWVYHWVVGPFSAKSAKNPLLMEIHRACNSFNPCHILTVDVEYVQVLRKFYFIKKSAFLRKLLTLQKCIIWWWCIIRQWMTVIPVMALYNQSWSQPNLTIPKPYHWQIPQSAGTLAKLFNFHLLVSSNDIRIFFLLI